MSALSRNPLILVGAFALGLGGSAAFGQFETGDPLFDATKQAIAAGQNPLVVFATGDANGNGVFEDPADASVFQEAYYRYLNDFNDVVKRQLGIAKHK
ncbi:MAG: hypothetical protein SFZ23_13010 [Planctomycetota bacterium]|nr:hypothetical protein [Planctomycetota bacterium]